MVGQMQYEKLLNLKIDKLLEVANGLPFTPKVIQDLEKEFEENPEEELL